MKALVKVGLGLLVGGLIGGAVAIAGKKHADESIDEVEVNLDNNDSDSDEDEEEEAE